MKSLDDDGTVLGTAVTDSTGHLVWKTIVNHNGLIFNTDRQRVTDIQDPNAIGKTVILRQNSGGYQFTETYAPDNAYNKGESFTVKITAKNYTDYRDGGYRENVYVDILAANGAQDHTVASLTTREEEPTGTDLVNPPFEASFELYKYDAEHPQINEQHNNYGVIGLKGVTFTLYKQQTDGTYPQTGTTYTTSENGLLRINLTQKGTYKLVETSPLTGYQLNGKEMIFTIVNGDYQKTVTYSDTAENHTVAVKKKDGNPIADTAVYDLPNSREHGTVTLTKQDADSGVTLNGVKYTLTRTEPAVNANVDKWFPKDVTSITVETGKTYTVAASAENEQAFTKGIFTGNSGTLVIQDLQWGTYTLVECQENNGYILDSSKTFTFTIAANGLTKTVTDDGKQFVTNTKNRLTIQKTALDRTTSLNGAEFQLYPVEETQGTETMSRTPAHFYTAANAEAAAGTTITAGETTIYGLTKGTYVLRETKAPDGYELTKDVIFTMSETGEVTDVTTCTVGENGAITRDTSGDDVVTLTTSGTGTAISSTLKVMDKPIEVSLTKVLLDNVAISGRGDAEYEITGIFAGNPAKQTLTFTGNTITDALKAKLIGGNTYTITETKAPAGYEVQKDSATISVATDGTITVTAGNAFLTVDNTTGTAALTFTDDPIELTLSKVDANGNAIDETNLDYATFKIEGKFVKTDGSGTENTTIEGLKTTDFTSKLSKRLIGGEIYLVTETAAPKGYKVAAPFYIQVNQYGEIVKRGATVQTMTDVNLATDTLVVADEPNTITFKKVDDNGPLAGAQFTLTAETGTSDVFVNMTEALKPEGVTSWTPTEIAWTSTGSAEGITFTNHLIAGVRYKLHEERVLLHEVMSNDIIFHLEPDGTVVIDANSAIPNNSGVAASLNGTAMTIRNPVIKGSVTLTKYWKAGSGETNVYDHDHLLPGAVYKLTMVKNASGASVSQVITTNPKTADGYAYSETGTVERFTTDANGQITITGLPEGTYEFLEVDAPAAYHINNAEADKIQFTIVNDTYAHVTIDQVMDTRINAKISLTKYLSDGTTPLENAVFDVTYSESGTEGTYTSIGTMKTGSDGKATFIQGTYPGSTDPEGLRRGFYRLTELSADGQMLNTENGTRNTITFQIGNEINKLYEVKSGTGVTYTVDGSFISLNDNGVVDTPIPTKSVTVKKVWSDDTGLENTFRPTSVQVQLYRSCNGGDPVAVEGSTQTLNAVNSWTCTWTGLPAYVNDGAGDQKTTYLYTYTVKEVGPKSWYTVTYSYETEKTETQNPNVEDGNTASTITNTLNGGAEEKTLTIYKTLGGGATEDAFQVRVKLTNGAQSVGNKGYFLDPCTLTKADNTTDTVTPDADGWMTIHGGESITVKLPKGITYEVEEQAYTSGDNGLNYTPRYDANHTGTIGTEDVSTTIRNAVQKSLNLVKQDDSTPATKLSDARFEITYTPLTGSSYAGTAYTQTFTTNSDGKIVDSYGKPIDLTNQGTYTIKETKAPDGYITPTDNAGNPIVLATITVDANDEMSVKSNSPLVTVRLDNYGSQASVTVKNEKTRARFGKTIDCANGTGLEGAKLEIYDSDNKKVLEWTTGSEPQVISDGNLKEGPIYRLHEVENSAPVGYLEAEDVWFKLDGTYTDANGTRYSRIVITDENGVVIDQNVTGSIYGDPGVVSGILKLADKAIKVPVTLKKVLEGDPLSDVIFTVTNKDTNTVIGTAKTGTDGFLVWEKTENGHTADEEIVLQQNTDGYTFTETYAPDHAYNDGRTFTVNPTDQNFKDYLNNKNLKLNVQTSATETKTDGFVSDTGTVINLPYKSTVTLYKYDKDEAQGNAAIPDAQFTLYHAIVDENDEWIKGTVVTDAYVTGADTPNTTGVFTTDENGSLSIEIHNKGPYILAETAAAPGYKLDTENPPTRVN